MRGLALIALAALMPLSQGVSAEDTVVEEVLVTGSYIKGSPIDAPSPVEIISRAEIEARGNPSVMEIVQRLSPVLGAEGRSNPYVGANQDGTASVNLRGLGPERTLVLLNGQRLASAADDYVNINAVPAIALERVELLKDGASATYGSDAIAGVVNFLTRSTFRGIELTGAIRDLDATDDADWEAGIIAGLGTERLDVVASFGYDFRGRIRNRNKDWVLQPGSVNPAGGYSPIGNPVTFLPFNTFALTPDPDCENVGGERDHPNPAPFCQFRFTDFFNLQEEEEHYQFFLEGNYALTAALSLHTEALVAKDDVPELWLSPSFPPLSVFGIDRVVVPGMPHFDDFVARNPRLAADMSSGALVLGRVLGVAGPEERGTRETDTYRVSGGFTWDFSDGMSVRSDAVYTRSEVDNLTFDTRIDNLAWAYRGFAGPDCDPDTGTPGSGHLGTGDCYYYNPFTSGFRFSQAAGFEGVPSPGGDNPQLNNPPWLMDWLKDPTTNLITTEMFVWDVIVDGDTSIALSGGEIAFAAGLQYREDQYNREPGELADSNQTPCAFGLGGLGDSFFVPPTFLPGGGAIPPWQYVCNGAGPFHFIAGTGPFKGDQDVVAVFGELALPMTETLDVQLALRYEDYGAEHGDTLDPKIAARWDATEWLSLRASYSSAFRAPPVSQLGGLETQYRFIAQEISFRPVDFVGNPDLDPEQADTYNVGVIWRPLDTLYFSLDYWRFEFTDPIVREPEDVVVNAALDPTHPGFELAQDKITFAPDGSIERITVTFTSGPDTDTDGIDYQVTWDHATDYGLLTFGARGTYINSYDVGSWIWAEGFDGEGHLNAGRPAPPIPQWKNNAYLNWSMGRHNVRADLWHTDGYDDRRDFGGDDGPIDELVTLDLHYNLNFNDDRTRLFASVINLTDEDPPFARLDHSYDPYTHDPFGIVFKLGVQHRFEVGPFQ